MDATKRAKQYKDEAQAVLTLIEKAHKYKKVSDRHSMLYLQCQRVIELANIVEVYYE